MACKAGRAAKCLACGSKPAASPECAFRQRPFEWAENYAMNGFLRATFNRDKLRGFFINTALGNFAAFVAGSLVTLVSTHHELERRAVNNLFGVLPRKTIVVHVMPRWLEWLLALILGFLVMEAVRYGFNHRKYAALLSALRPKRWSGSASRSGRPKTGERLSSHSEAAEDAAPDSKHLNPPEST
jgi:hypothetical protein